MDAEKTRRARGASYLLPDPGGEVVRDLLSVIDLIRGERDALAEQVRDLRKALEELTEAHDANRSIEEVDIALRAARVVVGRRNQPGLACNKCYHEVRNES